VGWPYSYLGPQPTYADLPAKRLSPDQVHQFADNQLRQKPHLQQQLFLRAWGCSGLSRLARRFRRYPYETPKIYVCQSEAY
jgi:hypothetical protein